MYHGPIFLRKWQNFTTSGYTAYNYISFKANLECSTDIVRNDGMKSIKESRKKTFVK